MHKDVRALPVRMLYQDEALVVVDKPSGMLVHRSPGARDPIVVMLWVRDLLGLRTWPVHRLDRPTSGAVVVAVDEEAARRLSRMFLKGRVEKTYLTAVAGELHEAGCIDAPLEKTEGRVQEARTDYVPLLVNGGRTWVRVHPVQGRRHQIRRHFAMIGHPLLGDETYGDVAENERARVEGGLDRLSLHAARIAFVHPMTREAMAVEAPIPDDLAGPLRRLGFLV